MLSFDRFDVLTFDCYGTLINWEDGILGCLRPILAAHAVKADDAAILRLYGDFEAAAEEGEYQPYRDVLSSVVHRFGSHFGFSPTNREARALAESLKDWKPWPDTPEALRKLERRFRLAIVSNVDDDLFAATRPQLGANFSQVITAQQAHAYKPSMKMFDHALSRVGTPPHRILHVAQSVYHDIVPARALGLATVWVNRPSARSGAGAAKAAEAQPDLEVPSLAELASVVEAQS